MASSAVLATITICVLETGCMHDGTRTPMLETRVAYESIAPAGTKRYELSDAQTATVPTQLENLAPEYPAAEIPLHLPRVTVQAKAIVDKTGKVSEVRIAPTAEMSAYPPAFDDAVRIAMAHWNYAPLRFRRFEDVLDTQGNVVDSRLISDDAEPFSMDYEFHFDLHDGKPTVDRVQPSGAQQK